MKKGIYILIFLLGTMLVSSFSSTIMNSKDGDYLLLTKTKKFVAGDEVILKFSSNSNIIPLLKIKNSYGITILDAVIEENILSFTIPESFSRKTGIMNWTLIYDGKIKLKNTIEIIPNTSTKTIIESYLGPISIQAGDRDFSMLVVAPTDSFDNPLPSNTAVQIHEQFYNIKNFSEQKTNNFIAWKKILSKKESGEIYVSSSSNTSNSKELSSVIYPSNAVDFTINYLRNHTFADGNQQTTFITSLIKDEFGNIVSDGTMVEFNIRNSENVLLKTIAITINGIAKGKILHPDYPTTWNVKAFISGLAESNNLTIRYESVTADFNVSLLEEKRRIVVGPLRSYMNQLIPDGAVVKLIIYSNKKMIEIKRQTSNKGYVYFYLDPAFYKESIYSFEIEALGVLKKIEPIDYEK